MPSEQNKLQELKQTIKNLILEEIYFLDPIITDFIDDPDKLQAFLMKQDYNSIKGILPKKDIQSNCQYLNDLLNSDNQTERRKTIKAITIDLIGLLQMQE